MQSPRIGALWQRTPIGARPTMSSPSTRSKSMPLTPKMEELRAAAPLSYPCFLMTGFYKPTSGCRERRAALFLQSRQTVKIRQSGLPLLQPAWRMKSSSASLTLAARSPLNLLQNVLARRRHMHRAPSRQARTRQLLHSLVGREPASFMVRIRPTTRQVAPGSQRSDLSARLVCQQVGLSAVECDDRMDTGISLLAW